jgi:hypothetical protein
MAAGAVIAAGKQRPPQYVIKTSMAAHRAYVIGTNLSALDPTDQVGRNDAEWFWSWQ